MILMPKFLRRFVHWQPKKIMSMYLAFFIAVFLLPVLLLTGNWMRNELNRQQENIVATHDRALKQTTANLDDTISHLITTAHQISLDTAFIGAPQEYPDFERIEQAIDRYNLSSQLITRTFIHMDSTPDTLYSADGTYTFSEASNKYGLLPTRINSNQRLNILHDNAPTLLTVPTNSSTDQMTLVVPLIPYSGGKMGEVFFSLNTREIQNLLANASSASQVLGLQTTTHNLILPQTKLANVALDQPTAVSHSRIKVLTNRSSLGLFRLTSYTLPAPRAAALFGFLGRYLWLFLTVFLIGGLLIWRFSNRQYDLIARLEQSLPFSTELSGSTSEALNLQNAIEDYIAEHQDLIENSRMQLPFARNQILQLILNGKVSGITSIKHFLDIVDLKLPHPNTVIILSDRDAEWQNHVPHEPTIKADYTVAFIFYEKHSQIVTLINYDDEIEIKPIIAKLRQQLTFIQPSTTLVVSQPLTNLADLHDTYIEVISGIVAVTPESGKTIFYNEVKPTTASNDDFFDFNAELKLENSLRHQDYEQSQEAFEILFNLACQNYDPNSRFDLGMSSLIAKIIRADYQQNAAFNDRLIRQLLNIESTSQLHGILLKTIRRITSYQPDTTSSAPDNLLQNQPDGELLKQYIIANVSSPTISLVDVADHFGLSVSHTSRYIKEITGKTFTVFVTERRILKIQHELCTTDLAIKDIIQQNGYYDVANFTRKFKKLTGFTPGEYRRAYQDSDDCSSEINHA